MFRKGGGAGMTLAKAAQRAIDLGGRLRRSRAAEGHQQVHTRRQRRRSPGQGLMGVAKDNYPHERPVAVVRRRVCRGRSRRRNRQSTASWIIWRWPTSARSFTRAISAVRFSAARCWASVMRLARSGCATSTTASRWPGVSTTTGRRRFSMRRQKMAWATVDLPDPETPVGARGIGEPPVGAGACAVLNAISDALGDDIVPAGSGDARHDSGGARGGPADHASAHCAHLSVHVVRGL